MKNILICLLLSCFSATNLLSQNFTYHSDSPFGIQTIKPNDRRSAQKVMFFDFDNDGDLDIFMSGLDSLDDVENPEWNNIHYFLEMQENIGDVHNPEFAARTSIFENFPFPLGYFFPAAGDLNGDGMVDFLINGEVDYIGNRTFIYSKNVTSGSEPQFENIKISVFGLDDLAPGSFFIPELTDLDSDGDLDILLSGFNPAFGEENGPDIPITYYAKNKGSATQPDFVGWYYDVFGLKQNPLVDIMCTGDIDNDGDMDALGTNIVIPADSINRIAVQINNSDPDGRPVFANTLSSPFCLPTSFGEEQLMFPNLVDIDGDSDLDLFVFKVTADGLKLKYYENDLCAVESSEMVTTICDGSSIIIGNIEYNMPGSYSIPLTGSDGCDSIVYLTLLVETVDNSVTVAQNVITANLSGATYQWVDCDANLNIPGATGQSYESGVSGNFAVNITSPTGCAVMSDCISIVTTGIRDIGISEGVNIYPNPTDNTIYVLNTTKYKVMSLTIADITGRTLKEVSMFGKNSVDISFLPTGIYLITISINGQDVVKKLVVK